MTLSLEQQCRGRRLAVRSHTWLMQVCYAVIGQFLATRSDSGDDVLNVLIEPAVQ